MKRWLKRISILLIVIVVLLVGTFAYVTSDAGIRTLILPKVSETLQTPISADKIKLSVTSGMEINNLAVGPAEEPVLKAGKVMVAWQLGELISGNVAVDQVLVADAEIKIVQDADGNLNLPIPAETEGGDTTTEPPAPGSATPAPSVNIKDLKLRNVSLEFVQEGETPLTSKLVISELSIPEIRNGGEINLTTTIAASAKRGSQTLAIEGLTVDATVPVNQDLLPTGAQLTVKGTIGVSDGATKLDNRRIEVDLAASETNQTYTLEKLEFRQFRGEIQEGNVSASGNWAMADQSGAAKIQADLPAGGIHAVAAKIAGGWDLGKTSVKYDGEATISGSKILAKGKAEVRRLTVASTEAGIPATTPLDLSIEHDVQATGDSVQVKALQVSASADGAQIVSATLASPILLDMETPEKSTGALTVKVDALDAALLAPFIPKDAPKIVAGKIYAGIEAKAGSSGELTTTGTCELRNFELTDKDLRIPALTIAVGIDTSIRDLDLTTINKVSLTTRISGANLLEVKGSGDYRLSTGEGSLNLTTLKATPSPILTQGVQLPGLTPADWNFGALTISAAKGIKATMRAGTVHAEGAISAGPIAGTFAGQEVAPPKSLHASIAFAADLNTAADGTAEISKLIAAISEQNGGSCQFSTTAPVVATLGEKPALSAPAKWAVTLDQFDLKSIAGFIPEDALLLQSGVVNANLNGTANWPEIAASAQGDVITKNLRFRLPGDDALPTFNAESTISLDADWSEKGPTTVRKFSVEAKESQFGTLSLSIPKPATIQLNGDNVPQTELPYTLKAQANVAPAQAFLPKDSVQLSGGTVQVELSGTASFPKVAATTKGTIILKDLAARAAGRDEVPAVSLSGDIALDAGWADTGFVEVRSLSANFAEKEAGTISLVLPKPFTVDLNTEKPKQSLIDFEADVALGKLQQFAGLLPQDAPVLESGSVAVKASGKVAYPNLGAIAKASVAVDNLKLHAIGADGPKIPRLAIKAELDGAWVDGEQARLQALSAEVKDLDADALSLALKLTEPGVLSLKEGAATNSTVAVSVSAKAKDLAQIAALLPADTLPVTLGGGSLDVQAAARVGLPKLAVDGDVAVNLKNVRIRPEGATDYLPAITGAIKADGAYADEWVTLKSNTALSDPQGSLVALAIDGRIDSTLLRPGSTLTISATDTISVDRLLALLPETTEDTTSTDTVAPTPTPTPGSPAAPAPAPQKLNLQAKLNIKRVTYQQIDVQDIKGEIVLSDGKATIQPITCSINGGPLELTGNADLAAVSGLPFDIVLKASALPLRPVFASFVPKAGDFTDGALATLNLSAKGPDVDWEKLAPTLAATFSGEIDQLRLTPSGKPIIDLVMDQLLKAAGMTWESLTFGDGKFSGDAANGTVHILADVSGEEARLKIAGPLNLIDYDPDLRITPFGRGDLASKSVLNTPADANGFVQLNVPIILNTYDWKRIAVVNAEPIARMSGVSSEDAALIGAGTQLIDGLFGKKKKDPEPKNGNTPKKKKSGGFGSFLNKALEVGVGELQRQENGNQAPEQQEPIKEDPKEQPKEEPPPKKKFGLGDFGF